MQRDRVLAVFCYDISRDRARTRVASLFEEDTVRVQESVFEGWTSRRRAEKLAARAAKQLGPTDSLRLYIIGPHDAIRTKVYGASVPVEAHEFHLL
jgi:CRISPR-associated endonuclease Cas2